MNKTDAANLLSYHSCRSDDVKNTKWTNGFLGSLLQFEGILHDDNFIEIMKCLEVLFDEFSKEKIDYKLMGDLVAIIHLGRRWTEKSENLEPNGLFSNEQKKQIRVWISIIENTVFNLLHGNIDEAFREYNEYI